MTRMLAVLCALTVGPVLTSPAGAQSTDHSATYYLPGCRDFANRKSGDNLFLQGECVGVLEGLLATASLLDPKFVVSRSCMPDGATVAQIVTVVVRWFDQHPERWLEDFRASALLALHDAWPCPTGN